MKTNQANVRHDKITVVVCRGRDKKKALIFTINNKGSLEEEERRKKRRKRRKKMNAKRVWQTKPFCILESGAVCE